VSLDPTLSFTSLDYLPHQILDQDTDWMGNPARNINNWSSWGQGPVEDMFHDLIPQTSTTNPTFTNQPPSELFYTNSNLPTTSNITQPNPLSKSRSEISSISDSSPETRSNGDDFDPSLNHSSSKSPNTHLSPSSPNNTNSRVKKRTLNTLAARRYRQKRVDQMQGLESTLKETETERDELKLKVARLEAEVDVLRRLLGSGNGNSNSS